MSIIIFFLCAFLFGQRLDADTQGLREGWYILYKTSVIMALEDNVPRVLEEKLAAKLDNDTYEYIKAEKDKLGVFGFRKAWVDDNGKIVNIHSLLIHDGEEKFVIDNTLEGIHYNVFTVIMTKEGFDIVWISRFRSNREDKYDSWAKGAIWHYRYWSSL